MARGFRALLVPLLASLAFTGQSLAAPRPHAAASSAIQHAQEDWLAGAPQAARRFGCNGALIQQLTSETVAEALKYFGQTAKPGACLILAPVSQDPTQQRYSFASGGKVNGVEILYLSDIAQPRIVNGTVLKVQ